MRHAGLGAEQRQGRPALQAFARREGCRGAGRAAPAGAAAHRARLSTRWGDRSITRLKSTCGPPLQQQTKRSRDDVSHPASKRPGVWYHGRLDALARPSMHACTDHRCPAGNPAEQPAPALSVRILPHQAGGAGLVGSVGPRSSPRCHLVKQGGNRLKRGLLCISQQQHAVRGGPDGSRQTAGAVGRCQQGSGIDCRGHPCRGGGRDGVGAACQRCAGCCQRRHRALQCHGWQLAVVGRLDCKMTEEGRRQPGAILWSMVSPFACNCGGELSARCALPLQTILVSPRVRHARQQRGTLAAGPAEAWRTLARHGSGNCRAATAYYRPLSSGAHRWSR